MNRLIKLVALLYIGQISPQVLATAHNLEDSEEYKKNYITVDKLKGPLASFLEKSPINIHEAKYSHILLSSQGLKNLTSEQKEYVHTSFNRGCVVACLHPEKEAIKEMLSILTPKWPHISDDDLIFSEILALRNDRRESQRVTFTSPSYFLPSFSQTLEEGQDYSKEARSMSSDTPFEDSVELQKERANNFLVWLKDIPLPKLKLKKAATIDSNSLSQDNILSIANAIKDIWKIQIPIILPDPKNTIITKNGIISKGPRNIIGTQNCQITTLCIALSAQDEEDTTKVHDYYYIAQSGIFSVNTHTKKNDLSVYAKSYHMESKPYASMYPEFIPDLSRYVDLLEPSPETTESYTSVSSSISYGFGGSVGFFGYTPTGDINANYSISNSKTISIPDVLVQNLSLSDNNELKGYHPPQEKNYLNNAEWKYTINEPKKTTMGRSTFEPYNQWLWRVNSEEVRKVSKDFAFRTLFLPTYIFSKKIIDFYLNKDLPPHKTNENVMIPFGRIFHIPFPPFAGKSEVDSESEKDSL